ncbi:Reverse transcriptase zinc-binding domain [Macleaya cordata]|uniref:Reverse transcriptase zinc-binding domain n=1 Tax=Macleaya cordata TaxID=56857 RepID=A0A200PS13_MACCD|nr:Reverse transcriptase zinc-binding domain [Macleaya cordata]
MLVGLSVMVPQLSSIEVEAICKIRLGPELVNDKLIWTKSKLGTFTTQSSYRCFIDQQPTSSSASSIQPDFPWKRFWAVKCISPRIHIFIWRLLSNALPLRTKTGHYIQGFDKICVLCGDEEEDLDHLFLKCRVVREFWFTSPIGTRVDHFSSIHDLISNWINHNDNAYRLGACLLWHFWKGRNRKIFDNIEMQFGNIFSAAMCSLSDYLPGVIKINVDAAYKEYKFAAAAIARDHNGLYLGCITKIGVAISVEEAELLAYSLGLTFAQRFTANSCWIEGDSLIVTNWINDSSLDIPWRLIALVNEARILSSSTSVNCVSFVRRCCNMVADSLASYAFKFSIDDCWNAVFPPACIEEAIACEHSSSSLLV